MLFGPALYQATIPTWHLTWIGRRSYARRYECHFGWVICVPGRSASDWKAGGLCGAA
ncbi:hypothetical protein CORC01_09568 [Colletotrichum orchidophilum]|uniref:Uncharacterized protein n=1 Tax=Colletotrichum orchidophilum TaxID=1209926 RepID=A0A1G4B1C2_9PEZI|nr:uncharacterized protein CORC01_09568 [Colletotrichum orchidophilum]OHE95181.1 hypothetical protein CORC01_09568 [Colletotrichum orchidophilum]